MPDVFDKAKRSAVMSAIRAKHTKPEIVVRRLLHLMGHRFRLHVSTLPGKPDIVISRYRAIVDVKGCFWHGHRCLRGRKPKTNAPYWLPKIVGNKARDRVNRRRLRAMGWRVKTIWECEIRESDPRMLYQKLQAFLPLSAKPLTATRLSQFDPLFTSLRTRRAAKATKYKSRLKKAR